MGHHFVHGVDEDDVGAPLQARADDHWAYMDAHAERLTARGPTLSADGTRQTGSVHVVMAGTKADAQRFADEEPYRLVGVYASVTVSRVQPAGQGTMWDRPPRDPASASALVLASWPAQARPSGAVADQQVLRMLSDMDLLVFGGLLVGGDGDASVGLVAAVDAEMGWAAALVAGVGLPGSTTSITSQRWRRGGRP